MSSTDEVSTGKRFELLSSRFAKMFESVKGASPRSFVRDDWAERNAELEAFLVPTPPAGFLRHPCILYQMFVGPQYLADELPYVLPRLADCRLASEDAVGNPPRTRLEDRDVVTSSNTIHHLYHLLRYEQETGIHVADQSRVVEWGGGYGNLAKLFRRLHGGSPTYVLVDTPLFSAVQWLYLSSIFGQEQVILHSDPSSPLAEGKFNVVPLGLVDKLAGFDADLFVSTWALNESTRQAQSHVLGARWFGARRLLLAMHKGDPLEEHVRAAGARETAVGDFMPPQRYFVR